MSGDVTLRRVAMGPYAPDFGVYAPSRYHADKIVSKQEFLERYADRPRAADVSRDGVSEPQPTTVYGFGLDCWYMVVPA